MKIMKKMEARDWVPGLAYFKFMRWVRAADLEDVRRMVKILGDHPPISMAKAKRCDPVFEAGQDLDQVFEVFQVLVYTYLYRKSANTSSRTNVPVFDCNVMKRPLCC